jgi:uncharacterized membrane protein YtjA (UPF0391 family)
VNANQATAKSLGFADSQQERETVMLRWAIVFAILALVAGLLGFVGLEGDFAYIAKILLFVFLVLFIVSLIFGRTSAPAV